MLQRPAVSQTGNDTNQYIRTQMNENKGSYTGYLRKKEAKGKWVPYWVELDGKYLQFYDSDKMEKLIGSVEIGSKTKCVVSKRKTYSFPFLICAAYGRHLFKCESAACRHRWMKAIHQAAELARLSMSTDLSPEADKIRVNDFENTATDSADESEMIENDDDILPPNVLLVASVSTECGPPSTPFKPRPRRLKFSDESTECEDERTSPKRKTVVFPFDRNSEQSAQGVSELERKQFSSLNIHSPFDSDPLSPRVRSFPTTPEKSVPPISPLPLGSSLFGKSRSLNSLASSSMEMRFSRHMVSGSDGGDIEI